MRRAFADRAQYLGDPDFVTNMPIARLISKEYATSCGKTINPNKASKSSPSDVHLADESHETTHFSVVDAQTQRRVDDLHARGGYGSKIVVPGAGFLLNNEMGDFNAGPGLTNEQGSSARSRTSRDRQADAVEHGADDRRQGRQAVHGHRHRRAAGRSSTPC